MILWTVIDKEIYYKELPVDMLPWVYTGFNGKETFVFDYLYRTNTLEIYDNLKTLVKNPNFPTKPIQFWTFRPD